MRVNIVPYEVYEVYEVRVNKVKNEIHVKSATIDSINSVDLVEIDPKLIPLIDYGQIHRTPAGSVRILRVLRDR